MGHWNPFKNIIYVKAFVRYNYLQNNPIPNGTALALLLEMELLLMLSMGSIITSFVILPLVISNAYHWYIIAFTLSVTLCNVFWFSDLRKLVVNLDKSLYALPHDIKAPTLINDPFSLYCAALAYKYHLNRYRYTDPTVRYLFRKISQTVNIVRSLAIVLVGTFASMVGHPLIGSGATLLVVSCLLLIYFFAKDIVVRLGKIDLSKAIKEDW